MSMATQLPLSWERPASRAITVEEQVPAFYPEFLRRALNLHRRGVKRFGAKAIIEGMRYDLTVATNDPNSSFKINNTYVTPITRRAVRGRPELAEMFALRGGE